MTAGPANVACILCGEFPMLNENVTLLPLHKLPTCSRESPILTCLQSDRSPVTRKQETVSPMLAGNYFLLNSHSILIGLFNAMLYSH